MKRLSVFVTAFILLAATTTSVMAQQYCSRCCRPVYNNNTYACQPAYGSMVQPGNVLMSGQPVTSGQIVVNGQVQSPGVMNSPPVMVMQPAGNYVSTMPGQVGGYSGGGSGLAQSKAQRAASMGLKNHVGGGLGGARYEGVGWSTVSAQSAIQACCYWGRRPVAEIGVARGVDGWYACVLYH